MLPILHGEGGAAVKFTPVVVSVFLFFGSMCLGQSAQPGSAMRRAQQWEAQNEKDFPPPKPVRVAVKPEALEDEAEQLVNLAAWVRTGVHNTNKGLLDKDLLNRLKQLEKLSKRLRDDLNR